MHKRKIDDLEATVNEFTDMKDTLRYQLVFRFAKIESDANMAAGPMNSTILGVNDKCIEIQQNAERKFNETD